MAAEEVELDHVKKEESSAEDGPADRVVPPDGGWGWVVMMAAFCCNVVVDGIIFSFGLLLTSLAESFNETSSKTAWVASLLSGFYMIAGPFVSSLANSFGFRTVAVLGSVIASLALAVSIFATSIEFLYITVGLIGGVGFGLIYVPAVVAVGFYFEKKRALATGIAVCGSGIGTFVLAPFTTWLIDEYGWRGTLLIHAGLVLNCAVFGASFRPLEAPKSARKSIRTDDEAVAGTPLMARMKRARDETLHKDPSNTILDSAVANDFQSSTNSLNTVKLVGIKSKRSDSAGSLERKDPKEKEILLTQETHATIVKSNSQLSVQTKIVSSDPDHHKNSSKAATKKKPEKGFSLSKLIQFSLFKSPTFNVVCISGFITFLGFFVPFMFLAARATQADIDKESASFLLSVIGIANTIGRVACGAFSDHPKVNVLFVNNFALTLGGIVTILTPLFPTYEMLIVYASLFGVSIGCFASLRSILLVELLGLENLTNAFGLMLLFTGVAATVGGPLAAMFYDATQDYDASFYLSGSMILISGILCYPLGYLNRWEKRQAASKVKPIPEPSAALSSA